MLRKIIGPKKRRQQEDRENYIKRRVIIYTFIQTLFCSSDQGD
jgi:hypothetical protein